MKANALIRIISRYIMAVCLIAATAGCGEMSVSTADGQGGSGTIVSGVGVGGTGVVKASGDTAPLLTGTSSMIGAVVFIDKNNNRLPDPNEPFTYTDQNGAYRLLVDPAEAELYPLLFQLVIGATIDKTTGQPVTGNFITTP